MLMLTAYIEVGAVERDAIHAALASVIRATRAEDGCDEHGCYAASRQAGRFVFVGRWRDRAALDRRLATRHMAEWMRVAGRRLKAAGGLVYDIASVTELRRK